MESGMTAMPLGRSVGHMSAVMRAVALRNTVSQAGRERIEARVDDLGDMQTRLEHACAPYVHGTAAALQATAENPALPQSVREAARVEQGKLGLDPAKSPEAAAQIAMQLDRLLDAAVARLQDAAGTPREALAAQQVAGVLVQARAQLQAAAVDLPSLQPVARRIDGVLAQAREQRAEADGPEAPAPRGPSFG